tara:strand:- start:610 stop:942 length:333 start_codon:yes stop_codon:yes gene_type:complete
MEKQQIVLHLKNARRIVKKLNGMPREEITRQHVNQFFDELRKELKDCIKINPYIFQSNDDGDDFDLLFLLTQKSIVNAPFGVYAKERLKAFLEKIDFELMCYQLSLYPLK